MTTHVEAKFELREVLGKVLGADMNMCAANADFQAGPEAFRRVDVGFAAYPFFGRMTDRRVPVAMFRQRGIGRQFVAANPRAARDVFKDMRLKGLAANVLHDAGDHVAVSLDHAEHDRLAGSTATALAALAATADHRFVNLDMARQSVVAVNLAHVFAQFVAHAPSRLVGHAKLALQFFGRNTVARRGEQVHGIEPLLQRRMRPLKGRSDHRVNMVAACRTGIGGKLLKLGELALVSAFRALKNLAETKRHKMLKAGVVIGKRLEKFVDCRTLGHVRNLRYPEYRKSGVVRQGDNHLFITNAAMLIQENFCNRSTEAMASDEYTVIVEGASGYRRRYRRKEGIKE